PRHPDRPFRHDAPAACAPPASSGHRRRHHAIIDRTTARQAARPAPAGNAAETRPLFVDSRGAFINVALLLSLEGRSNGMRIAQIAPLIESVPPRLYGGTERVVSYLTEELVRQGHDVTLFASADSVTAAKLVPCA